MHVNISVALDDKQVYRVPLVKITVGRRDITEVEFLQVIAGVAALGVAAVRLLIHLPRPSLSCCGSIDQNGARHGERRQATVHC